MPEVGGAQEKTRSAWCRARERSTASQQSASRAGPSAAARTLGSRSILTKLPPGGAPCPQGSQDELEYSMSRFYACLKSQFFSRV